jgi:hypothetical protein
VVLTTRVKLKDNLWIKWFHLHHLMPFYLLDNVNQWCHDRCLKRFLLPSYPPFSYTLNGQHILIIWLLLYNVAYLGGRCITTTIMLQIIRNNWEPMRCIFFLLHEYFKTKFALQIVLIVWEANYGYGDPVHHCML